MLRMMATPSNVQRYIADPISCQFTELVRENMPEVRIVETTSSIYFSKRRDVIDILRRVTGAYDGLRYYHRENEHFWVYPMRRVACYRGSKLVISLVELDDFYEFTTVIHLGKKRTKTWRPSMFSYLAILSALLVLGCAGSYEQNLCTTWQFIWREAISIGFTGLFGFIESRVNPITHAQVEAEESD